MASCVGNNTLDPYQSVIDAVNKGVVTLENQADFIQPYIDQFDAIAATITTPTLPSALNAALNQFTADAICASKTDLEPINDLVGDCLLEATASVKRYIKNIMYNIEDGISLVTDLITLPEGVLFTYYQRIRGLADNIKDLVTGLNNKISCVPPTGGYQSQIDDINTKINDVLDDLRLDVDGSFDPDTFLTGLASDLADNVKSYTTRADDLQDEIMDNISSTVDLTAAVNPKRYF